MSRQKKTATVPQVEAKKKGRPPGSKTKQYDVTEKTLTACKRCRSTKRAAYGKRSVLDFVNTQVNPTDDQEYNRLKRYPTHCLECGQHRIDLVREMRPEE